MEQRKRAGKSVWAGCLLTGILFFFPVTGRTAETAAVLQGTASAPPAGEKTLMLNEAVSIALENHPSVKSAQQQVGAQQAVVGQQLAAYYPTVSFSNLYRTTNTTGTTSVPGSKSFDFLSSTANVSMTLYNFGKREGTVESARDTLEATRDAYNATANNVVLAVKQAYYGVLQADALLKVRQETVKDRELLLRQTQAFNQVGIKPRSDVTQAQANFFSAQADLITAQNGVEVAWTTLRNAMGVDNYPELPLGEQLSVTPFPISLDEAKQAAFAARPELLQFAAQLKAQDQLLAVARRNHLPDILFSSIYGRQNNDQAVTRPHDMWPLEPTWQIQLSFNIPIFNGFQTTYQVEQALYTYNSITEQARLQRQQVTLQVEQSYLNLTAAREVVKANEATVKAAKENLDLQEGRYQVGVGSIVEVTDAQTTYTNAETNYVNALASYNVAQAQLLNAMGRQ